MNRFNRCERVWAANSHAAAQPDAGRNNVVQVQIVDPVDFQCMEVEVKGKRSRSSKVVVGGSKMVVGKCKVVVDRSKVVVGRSNMVAAGATWWRAGRKKTVNFFGSCIAQSKKFSDI